MKPGNRYQKRRYIGLLHVSIPLKHNFDILYLYLHKSINGNLEEKCKPQIVVSSMLSFCIILLLAVWLKNCFFSTCVNTSRALSAETNLQDVAKSITRISIKVNTVSHGYFKPFLKFLLYQQYNRQSDHDQAFHVC